MEVFRRDGEIRLASLTQAVAAGDRDGTRRDAHHLVGQSGTLGAVTLATLAATLEALATGGNLDGAGDLLDQIRSEFKRAETALLRAAVAATPTR